MPWEKSSADLVRLFEQIVPAGPNVHQRKMFGYASAFVNGKHFIGLFRQSVVFRLAPADRAAFLEQPGTADFEPMPGRKMTGYVLVHDPFAAGEDVLMNWAKCAMEFASRLSEKAPAKKKKP